MRGDGCACRTIEVCRKRMYGIGKEWELFFVHQLRVRNCVPGEGEISGPRVPPIHSISSTNAKGTLFARSACCFSQGQVLTSSTGNRAWEVVDVSTVNANKKEAIISLLFGYGCRKWVGISRNTVSTLANVPHEVTSIVCMAFRVTHNIISCLAWRAGSCSQHQDSPTEEEHEHP